MRFGVMLFTKHIEGRPRARRLYAATIIEPSLIETQYITPLENHVICSLYIENAERGFIYGTLLVEVRRSPKSGSDSESRATRERSALKP